MLDRLGVLYPPAAANTLVVPRFPSPCLPTRPDQPNRGTVREFYGPNLLTEFTVSGTPDLVAAIHKAIPHSRYDAMFLVSNDEIRSAVSDLAPSTLQLILYLGYRFVEYVSDPKTIKRYGLDAGQVHLCFNYDPDTLDRENGMFWDKRFHLHLNYWPGRDLATLTPTTFREVTDVVTRRRLIDPVSYVAARTMYDVLGGWAGTLAVLRPDEVRDIQMGLPVGLKLPLPGWSYLLDDRLGDVLRILHTAAVKAYREIYRAFTGIEPTPRPWWRPTLLPRPQIAANLAHVAWLSKESEQQLVVLSSLLANVSERSMRHYREDASAPSRDRIGGPSSLKLALAGLDYSVGFFTPHRNSANSPINCGPTLYLLMQFKPFGDIGGAGLPPLGGTAAARLDRRNGYDLTSDEIMERRLFLEEFLDGEIPTLEAGNRIRYLH